MSFFDNKLAVFYSVAAFLLAMVAAWVFRRSLEADPQDKDSTGRYRLSAGLLVFLCAGLVLHGSFPSPIIPDQAQGARVEAVSYLIQHFPQNTPVAAAIPGPV